jgi:hypothetical protein
MSPKPHTAYLRWGGERERGNVKHITSGEDSVAIRRVYKVDVPPAK